MHFIAKTKKEIGIPCPLWTGKCLVYQTLHKKKKKEFPIAYLEMPQFFPNRNGEISAENPKTSSVFRSTSLFVAVPIWG